MTHSNKSLTTLGNLSELYTVCPENPHDPNGIRQYFQKIIDVMPNNVYWLNRDCIMMGCNKNTLELVGLKRLEDFVGLSYEELSKIAGWVEGQAESFKHDDMEVMAKGKPKFNVEEPVLYDKNGDPVYYFSSRVPLFDSKGDVIGVVGISVNITERKRQEAQLIRAKKEAEDATRAKTEFLANMSHDIRTPLVGMISLAEYLYDQVKNKEHKKVVSQMADLSRNLLEVSNSLIEAAQVESGKFPVLEEVFNLKKMVAGVKALLQPAAEAKNLKFYVEQSPALTDSWLGDVKRIRRIIINLVSNAIKFTEKGFIKISVDVESKSPTQQILKIKIQDTGSGIPRKKQELIFKRFTRLDSTEDTQYKGFGIGLSIVDQFIKELGGSIQLESDENKGSVFICSIPVKQMSDDRGRALTIKEESAMFYKGEKLPKLRVLVIEDNEIASFSALRLLEKFQFTVDITEGAEKGVQLHTENHYDLIFTDLRLEDRDGCWLANAIRNLEKNSLTCSPVVIVGLSAHLGKIEEKQCVDAGMNKCFLKPLTQPKILEILKEHFSYGGEAATSTRSENQETAAKIIDLEASAKDYYSGDIGAARRMLELLLKGLSEEKDRMEQAFVKKDWDMLYRLVHNFYGGCVSCGVPRLSKALAALKNALRKRLGEQDLALLHEKIIAEMKVLEQFYKEKYQSDEL